MKYSIKIDNQTFSVELEDLHARPIVALVDGERFEIWPEIGAGADAPVVHRPSVALSQASASAPVVSRPPTAPAARPAQSITNAGPMVKAPLPGVVIAVLVKPGDSIKNGQELCTIEAMKMKNAIRATRDGTVADVLVQVGQTVNHGAPLVAFTE